MKRLVAGLSPQPEKPPKAPVEAASEFRDGESGDHQATPAAAAQRVGGAKERLEVEAVEGAATSRNMKHVVYIYMYVITYERDTHKEL